MASIDKRSNGYRARVRKLDQYGRFIDESKTFIRKIVAITTFRINNPSPFIISPTNPVDTYL